MQWQCLVWLSLMVAVFIRRGYDLACFLIGDMTKFVCFMSWEQEILTQVVSKDSVRHLLLPKRTSLAMSRPSKFAKL